MKKVLSAVVLTMVAATVACGPSINPKTKAIVDAWQAALNNSSSHHKAAGIKRPAFAAGQWAQYLEVDKEQRPAQVTYKILGEDAGAVWLETERISYTDHAVTKMLVYAPDWTRPDGWEFRRVISQQHGREAAEMPPFLMNMFAKPFVSMLRIDVQSGPAETVTVPAGIFDGAVKNEARVDTVIGSVTSEVWIHGAVPVTGYIRSQSQDGAFKTELVAFGNTGAASAIVGPVQSGSFH